MMNYIKLLKFRLERLFVLFTALACILIGFLTILTIGCGSNSDENNMEFKKINGRVEPLTYQSISKPSVTLAIKKGIHFPYLEIEARLAPPFELPRRLQGGALQFRVHSVKMRGDLEIHDKDHAFEKNMFTNVIWLNFDDDQGIWSGSRQVYLSDFRNIALNDITNVEGTMFLRLPIDPMSVEFNLKDYDDKYEIKGVRFEIEHFSSKKIELLIFGSDENYMGMDARVKGKWVRTLGRGSAYTKTVKDQVVTEEHRISVKFPQPVEAIKLYFCSEYSSVESEIQLVPESTFTKNIE